MPRKLDSALLTGWVRAATSALERHRAEIDRINVFPVADGDTGTNLLLTMRSAADSVKRAVQEKRGFDALSGALARGALLGARGNSGVILSQVLRGVAEATARVKGEPAGVVFADALRRAHRLATASVTRPVEGTVLSVLAAAAGAAATTAESGEDGLEDVVVAAADAAAQAVRATTGQLPELARAGVVDAGGLGIYLVLDALAAVVSGRAPRDLPREGLVARAKGMLTARRERGSSEHDYEVMYLLDGTSPELVDGLRRRLGELGDSVTIAGDGDGPWNVHVHCTDIGAAIEAGIERGRPHRITVMRLTEDRTPSPVKETEAVPGAAEEVAPGDRFTRDRAVLLVVPAAGEADTTTELAGLARAAGAVVLERRADSGIDDGQFLAALIGTRARHVVLLPDDADLAPAAEQAAAAARRDGQEVLVMPTSSVLQGLAALAVHDPDRRPDEDVVAMAEAAAGTRTGGLQVAETEALTWVGRCEPGECLGITDGEVVLIAPDLAVGGLWLAHRMLTAGGEIVTVLLAEGTDPAFGDGLAADLRRTHPEVDVVVHRGGQSEYPVVLGVE